MPCDKSSAHRGTRAPMIDSEFVRTCLPRRSLMRGSEPFSLRRKSNSMVPSDDAEKTTARLVSVRGLLRIHAMEFTVQTSYPALPSPHASQRFDVHHFRFWKNHGPMFLCQVEVVEIQRILRTIAAAHHATAAAGARGSRRTFAAEKWIGKSLVCRSPFGRLEDSHTSAVEGMAGARNFAGSFQEVDRQARGYYFALLRACARQSR